MGKYIPLSGLATNPSDFDAPDGQLGTCLNLIPEDEALHTISLNKEFSFVLGGSSCSLIYKHVGPEFTNYIIQCESAGVYTYYYLPSTSASSLADNKQTIYGLPNTKVNSVSSIGTILVLMYDDTTCYLFWNGTSYDMVGDFQYNVYVTTLSYHTIESNNKIIFDGTGTSSKSAIPASLEDNPVTVNNEIVSDGECREMYNALVASLNRLISEYDSKHILRGTCLGVVALQLYDGSYIAISDPFLLAPDQRDQIDNCTVEIQPDTTKIIKIYGFLSTAKYKVSVKKQLSDAMKKIVSGAVLFITKPIELWDVDKSHRIGSQLPGNNQQYSFAFTRLTVEKIKERINTLQFYRSVSFSAEELNYGYLGVTKDVEAVTGAEESISLADFRRSVYSAKLSYLYNNRLHIAGTAEEYPLQRPFVDYVLPKYSDGEHIQSWFLGYTMEEPKIAEAKYIITFNDGREIYQYGTVCWPLPPLLSFPDRNASKLEMYIKVETDPELQEYTYYKIVTDANTEYKELTQSQGYDMAYFLKLDTTAGINEFHFLQNTDVEVITEIDYNAITSAVVNNKKTRTNNILRYSMAENPFVFPVTNYKSVGNAEILGIATSTQPISEGQFGVAPLYVFTAEATWALTVDNDGTYDARQPATRDVLVNQNSITPIDTAVVFATARGIMLIQGNTSVCLTEQLDGAPFVYASSLPASATSLLTATNNTYDDDDDVYTQTTIPSQPLVYQPFKSEFLQDCKIIYDYASQKLVLFNPKMNSDTPPATAMPYAYVYSFRSKQWGVCQCEYKDVTKDYPGQFAIIERGSNVVRYAVDGYVVDGSRQKVLFCTRPLKLDAPFDFKTIRSLVVRGNFYPHTKLSIVIYGSNDLLHWQQVSSSYNHIIRGRLGNPWKYFRVVVIGELHEHQSISGLHVDFFSRWQNQIR